MFDVHDELHGIPGANACRYSQATGYGYNPLELDTDPHTGGVNRQIEYLLGLISGSLPQFGVKQAMVLRNLLVDTYALAGIYPDNHATWQRNSIHRKRAQATHRCPQLASPQTVLSHAG